MALSKNILKWRELAQRPLPEFFQCQQRLRMEPIKSHVVHEFTMGDVDDPDLYASQPLWEFQQSEKGQWVLEHAVEAPVYVRAVDYIYYGYRYKISAKFYESDLTYYLLKWN